MTNVMIVDDQSLVRGYFEGLIGSDTEFRLCASVAKASDAPEICRNTKIDLVLMDVMTERGSNGLDATKEIKDIRTETKVVIVTSLVDSLVLSKAKVCGADSLWYKDDSEQTLMEIIHRTMAGEQIFPGNPPVVEIGTAKSLEFTKKEMEVLRYVVRGLPYPQIAEAMNVDVRTIKYHVASMLQKTNCENKLQLAVAVHDAKLIVTDI